ncbi:DUF2268 domain-containing protein [Ornithinibacillus californiensis]|uniref:DUF2268 domain-containing protein n=1 Tax=Ornithinibacillus californiensis TaxID=161536 RepID=UPI00064E1170|nr:DUF2268 domain-containing protein [Ornithinibacillus californiensis]
MAVIRTDKWLEKSYSTPDKLFQKLTNYFNHDNSTEIASLLTSHGMYQRPEPNGENMIQALRNKKIWDIVQQEEKNLKREWDGRNIPIFIFPSNSYNRKIREHYNGRTGLAFQDKLFLFVSEETTEEEIKALFTHEYNHSCRLTHDKIKEKNYTLLDIVILEGLAENAVRERFGTRPLAPWTTYYSDTELEKMWNDLILPSKDLPKSNRKASKLLYGSSFYPDMVGYSVGYYLVKQYMKKTSKRSKELLSLPAQEIAFD